MASKKHRKNRKIISLPARPRNDIGKLIFGVIFLHHDQYFHLYGTRKNPVL